jgi:hypothetical protein
MCLNKVNIASIYEVPLAGSFGFGYVKVIEYDYLIVKPLDFFSEKRISKEQFGFLSDLPYAFAPYILFSKIKTKGDKSWKFIMNSPIKEDEIHPPEFKNHFNLKLNFTPDDLRNSNWYIVKNLNPAPACPANFDDIQNLGLWNHGNSIYVALCLTAAWMLKKGVDIDKFVENSIEDFPLDQWNYCVFNEKLMFI